MNRKLVLIVLPACLVLALALWTVGNASPDAWRTLLSLRKVDDRPLYVMCYYGDYALPVVGQPSTNRLGARRPIRKVAEPAWACTCFAALADPEAVVYGRNFDWYDHPALLLFTAPPGRYASVSMVDISYLGVGAEGVSWSERRRFLAAPRLPFDGMNERGLVVGMMAVPEAEAPRDPERETVDSLLIIRLLLDNAQDVEEALAILEQYNIDWGSGPPLHYLVADAGGHSAVIEFVQGEMRVLNNSQLWQVATNFVLVESEPQGADSPCWRYNRTYEMLQQADGRVSMEQAMALLQRVSQENTIWSTVYGVGQGRIQVAMGREYDRSYSFSFEVRP